MSDAKQNYKSLQEITFLQPFSGMRLLFFGFSRNNFFLLWAILNYASIFFESLLLLMLYRFKSYEHTPASFQILSFVTPLFLLYLLTCRNAETQRNLTREDLFNKTLNYLRNEFFALSIILIGAVFYVVQESAWRIFPLAFQVSILGTWLSMPWMLLVLSILYQQKTLQYPLVPCNLRFWWVLALLLPLVFQAVGLPLLSLLVKVVASISICAAVWQGIPGQNLSTLFARPQRLYNLSTYGEWFKNSLKFLLLAYLCFFISTLSLNAVTSYESLYEKLLAYKYHFLTLLLSLKAFLSLSKWSITFLTYANISFRVCTLLKITLSIFFSSVALLLFGFTAIVTFIDPHFAIAKFLPFALMSFIGINTILNCAIIVLRTQAALGCILLIILYGLLNVRSLMLVSEHQQLMLLYVGTLALVFLLPTPNIRRRHAETLAQLRQMIDSSNPLFGFSTFAAREDLNHRENFPKQILWLSNTEGLVLLTKENCSIEAYVYAMNHWSLCRDTDRSARKNFVKKIIKADFTKISAQELPSQDPQAAQTIKRGFLGWSISSIENLHDQCSAMLYLEKLYSAQSRQLFLLYKRKSCSGWFFKISGSKDIEIQYLNKDQRSRQDLLSLQLNNIEGL